MAGKLEKVRVSGPEFAALGNATSDLIASAMAEGMGAGEAASIVAAVAADYVRGEYGPEGIEALVEVVMARLGADMPDVEYVQ